MLFKEMIPSIDPKDFTCPKEILMKLNAKLFCLKQITFSKGNWLIECQSVYEQS
jgi:hypothetical protein